MKHLLDPKNSTRNFYVYSNSFIFLKYHLMCYHPHSIEKVETGTLNKLPKFST